MMLEAIVIKKKQFEKAVFTIRSFKDPCFILAALAVAVAAPYDL